MSNQKPFNITKQNLPVLIAKLNDLLDCEGDKHWQVFIKEKDDSRSLDQNARLWELYTSIGDYLGYTAQEIHELMGYKFLLREKTINGEKITKIESTTKLSVKEMADYQTKVEAFASHLGWSFN